MTNKPHSIVILISGSGSNLQAIIDSLHNPGITKIVCVISNTSDALGITRAKKSNIPTQIVDHTLFPSRQKFETALTASITQYQPDLIVLAGFMRILSDQFINAFPNKIINIHPSLLPKHKGLNTHQQAIDAGETLHGATVHLVIPELDSGPIIAQSTVSIDKNDTAETLAKKVLLKEHQLYPEVIKWLRYQWITISEEGKITFEKPWRPC